MSITVRKATPADYEAILQMDPDNKIYGGNDYLPAEFHRFMRDPNMGISVCILNGKIVAMSLGCKVDDGKTLLSMAGRSHFNLREKGIWRQFKKSTTVGGLSYTGVTHLAGATMYYLTTGRRKRETVWAEPHTLLKMIVRTFQFDSAAIGKNNNLSTKELSTKILTSTECINYLCDPDIQWLLFPNKRIVCDSFIIYRLLESNFHRITANMKCITASLDAQSQCKSMAFAHGHEVHNGYLYSIYYYSNDPYDVTDVKHHVTVHLPMAAKQQTKEPLLVRIIVPSTMNEVNIPAACKDLPGFKQAIGEAWPLIAVEHEKDDAIVSKL